MSEPVEVLIVPVAGTDLDNLVGAQDLAWEHATTLASQVDMDFTNPDFEGVYSKLLEGYIFCTDHMGFMQNFALRLLHELVNKSPVGLFIPRDASPKKATEVVQEAAQIVLGGVMSLLASKDITWVTNAEWDDLDDEVRGVSFAFNTVNFSKGEGIDE